MRSQIMGGPNKGVNDFTLRICFRGYPNISDQPPQVCFLVDPSTRGRERVFQYIFQCVFRSMQSGATE